MLYTNTTGPWCDEYFYIFVSLYITLVPEVYFYYFHCEGERKNKPLVESGNRFIEPRQSVWIRVRSWPQSRVPTFFVRMLGKLLDACIWLDDDLMTTHFKLAEHAQLIIFRPITWKKWVHDNVIFRSVYNGQLRLCMSYLLCVLTLSPDWMIVLKLSDWFK
jgi:hypothetical protein